MIRGVEDLAQSEVSGKNVFVRVDFNVPVDDKGNIQDTFRVDAAKQTLELINSLGPKVVYLCSHMGRPLSNDATKFSLKVVHTYLQQSYPDISFMQLEKLTGEEKGMVLLENIRYFDEEEGKMKRGTKDEAKCDSTAVDEFRKKLSSITDVFVNEAFATSHRAHSSVVGVNASIKVMGLLVQKEVEAFDKVLKAQMNPAIAIMGGAKVSDKMQLISNILDKVQTIAFVGGIANTFLLYKDKMKVGRSLVDKSTNVQELVNQILEKAKKLNVTIWLPTDFICSESMDDDNNTHLRNTKGDPILDNESIFDIGSESRESLVDLIKKHKLFLWNGPCGVYEKDGFIGGSKYVADQTAHLNNIFRVIGGGDTAALITKVGLEHKQFDHVSTGGGAALELLEGKELPGIEILDKKTN